MCIERIQFSLERTSWPLLLALCLFVATVMAAVNHTYGTYSAWSAERLNFTSARPTDDQRTCDQIQATCRDLHQHRSDSSSPSSTLPRPEPKRNEYDAILDQLLCQAEVQKRLGLSCKDSNRVRDPGPFNEYYLDNFHRISLLGRLFFFLITLLLVTTTGKVYLSELNAGWRRVAVVTGALSTLLTTAFSLFQERPMFEIATTSAFGFACAVLLTLFVRRVLHWIQLGFSPVSSMPDTSLNTTRELPVHPETLRLRGKLGARLIIAAAALMFLIVAFIRNPDSFVALFGVTAVAALIVGVALSAVRRLATPKEPRKD